MLKLLSEQSHALSLKRSGGVSIITAFRSKLEVQLTGPAVGPGRLAARDVAVLTQSLYQVLFRIGQVLSRTVKQGPRPSAHEIGELCRLYLVSWTPGSAVAGFDFAEPNRKAVEFRYLSEDSLSIFLKGLSEITAAETPDTPMPQGYDSRVLETCAKLSNLLEHGVAAMTFAAPALPDMSAVKYDAWVGERIRVLVDRTKVRESAGRFLTFDGQLRPSKPLITRPRVVTALPEVESSFWKPTPLERLAADQGVPPIMDIKELDAIWSEGDVFDDALSELLQDRAERRRHSGRRAR